MSTLEIIVLGAVLGALIVLVVTRWTNPVVDVADELGTTVVPSEVDALVASLLTTSPKVDVRTPLPGTYVLTYLVTPLFVWLIVIVAFPLGLLALFIRDEQTLTVSITPDDHGSRIQVIGRVHAKLATAFGATLRAQLKHASTGV